MPSEESHLGSSDVTVPRAAPPSSTYRLQLGPDLTFADVARLADYLAALGVSHAYLSPILGAVPGSTHGYDVTDPTQIRSELGGEPEFLAMCRALRRVGVGVVVDIVPNHMAVPAPESLNEPLWSVLRDGRRSPYTPWFDIDWDAGGGRVMMPVLGGPLADNLDRLQVDRSAGQAPRLRYFEHRFPIADETADLPIEKLVEAQHYRLTDWREAVTQLNYRRFCDITTLIGLRVEDREVFAWAHALIARLVAEGHVDGLRIDHPDGLANPAKYLADLADLAGSPWVVVEKVLADGEPLPPDWRAAGSTGYETLTMINELLVDSAGEQALTRTYQDVTADLDDFATLSREGRRFVARNVLAAELNRLATLLAKPAGRAEHSPDSLVEALTEVLCGLDVYRPFTSSPRTIESLRRATDAAAQRRPDLAGEIRTVGERAAGSDEFATRFGQTAAALFAKGVEDTAFYRYGRLLSLNEVGGDPGRFGCEPADFHAFAGRLQANWPTAMTTLSTHDTKRSEDVRARLAVLSELPDQWDAAVRRWQARAVPLGCPDPRVGYVFWQTIVGAWPLDAERAGRYLEKATREAKLATSWHTPDERYDKAVQDFAAAVFDDEPLLADVEAFVRLLEPYAHANSLAQKLIQLTMPGVPDVYQGCELANFRLVDPDNRGPVDFAERRAALEEFLDDKLRLTATALRLRREHPEWFAGYEPLEASGPAARHVVAFARSAQLFAFATRLPARLLRDGGWRDTATSLPAGTWVDVLSGKEHDGGDHLLAQLIGDRAVALLVPGVSVAP